MLIPLLAPDPSGKPAGAAKIAQALGLAGVKAVFCIVSIIAGGRLVLRPLYKRIAGLANAEIFAATTLLVVLGTSLTTQLAGLSLALGAFLAGLLLAETEYALQVESDIAPYKGLLMGLFFMTVGMQISVGLFCAQWKTILLSIVVLIAGKLAVMVAAGQAFGLSRVAALRAGLLLASGGEFAFVAFGEAVSKGVLPADLTGQLYMVVALSMALVPYLAMLGAKLGALLESGSRSASDPAALQPDQGEVKDLKNHVIIAGYGRVGQMIGQMLSEELIPFVAVDIDSNRWGAGSVGCVSARASCRRSHGFGVQERGGISGAGDAACQCASGPCPTACQFWWSGCGTNVAAWFLPSLSLPLSQKKSACASVLELKKCDIWHG
jgi:hypothetical protein